MARMARANVLTRDDLNALPDDGLRHELIDGAFVMTPAPGRLHQRVVFSLARALHSAAEGSDLEVLLAPFDVVLGPNVVQPDIVVAPAAAFTERDLPVAPLLAVEVRSQATTWLDEGRKHTLYEQHGVASYWLVDPVAASITILELKQGGYRTTAVARGDQTITVQAPFTVSLNPADLARS